MKKTEDGYARMAEIAETDVCVGYSFKLSKKYSEWHEYRGEVNGLMRAAMAVYGCPPDEFCNDLYDKVKASHPHNYGEVWTGFYA